jgi:GNAT superfamily N-acetyltransferase
MRGMSVNVAEVELEFQPLTKERWTDLEALFGRRGAYGGCWCMWWRLSNQEFSAGAGEGNREAFRQLVGSEVPTGVLAYAEGKAVGWCAIAPRDHYPRLARSRVLAPVDETPVWSITCFYVTRPYRRKGVSYRLIQAAVDYARSRDAKIVEGYPVEPDAEKGMPDPYAYTGLADAFRKAGFVEVARRSPRRPIMRFKC